jgi:hypothetical protein
VKVRPVAIIWCAIALHVLWGCLLLINGAVVDATALHAFAGLSRYLTAAILFAVAAMAIAGVTWHGPRPLTLALLLPQQAVLSISALSAIMAVFEGRYGDGVPRPWYFILADQAPVILTMVLHTIAVAQLHMTGGPAADLRAKLAHVQEEAERLRTRLADRHSEIAGSPDGLADGAWPGAGPSAEAGAGNSDKSSAKAGEGSENGGAGERDRSR